MDLRIEDIVLAADPDVWVPVPLLFPFAEWATPAAWGGELAAALARDVSMPDEVTTQLADLATDIASTPPPRDEALAKLWYFPRTGGGIQVAHCYATDRRAVGDESLETLALGGESGLVPQRVEQMDVAGMTRSLRVLATVPLTADGIEATTMTVARVVGEVGGVIVEFEVLDTGVDLIAEMLPQLEALLAAVSFEPAP